MGRCVLRRPGQRCWSNDSKGVGVSARPPPGRSNQPRKCGAWMTTGWDSIGFTRHALREFLEKQGYDVEGVIREWADRGWLERGSDHGAPSLTKSFRMGSQVARGYVVTRAAFEAVGSSGPLGEDQ